MRNAFFQHHQRKWPRAGNRAWPLILALLLAWLPGFAQDASPPFRLGVVNERIDRPDFSLEQFGELQQYLDRHLLAHGMGGAELVVAADIDDMQRRVAGGEVDALIEGVLVTLAIAKQVDRLRPALVVWRKGQRQYHSVFFAAQDSAIVELTDLAGKTLAFESPRSTSAYFVPRAALRAAGLSLRPADEAARQAAATAAVMADHPRAYHPGADHPGTDESASARFRFAGSELNQAYWVQRGRADAGAFNNGDWERLPERLRGHLRIFHRTRPLLRWLLSFDSTFPATKRDAVIAVLTEMHQNAAGQAALRQAARIARFEPLTASDRESLDYWAGVLGQLD